MIVFHQHCVEDNSLSEVSYDRNSRGEWRPSKPITLAPINNWPIKFPTMSKWFFGFPGFLWPYNAFWMGITLLTWCYLTPDLSTMATFELWWVGLIFARNLALITLLFGGLHLYLYVFQGQGNNHRFTTRPFAKGSKKFLFKNQVRDNMIRTLASAVPIITGYEVFTYWAFANGYLGLFDLGSSQVVFWSWFVFLILLAPAIHAVHFYLGHRLLHVKFLYNRFHALHHRNVEVGPWSGLAMHPVEHLIYLSTLMVQWLIAAHPVNALFQLQLAAFYPALSHSGFDKLMIGKKLGIDGGNHFHYLHHKHFECNYGGSLAPLDKWFGTFHDGSKEADVKMRERIKARRDELRQRV